MLTRRLTSGRNSSAEGGGPPEALAVPSFSAWSVGAMPPGLQPQQQSQLGPGAAGAALYGLAGHPAQLPPYAASPRYGDVNQLLNPQGMYTPQGAFQIP